MLAEMKEAAAGSNHGVSKVKVRALHGGRLSPDTIFLGFKEECDEAGGKNSRGWGVVWDGAQSVSELEDL